MISICRKHDFYKNGILISNDRTADVTSTGLFTLDKFDIHFLLPDNGVAEIQSKSTGHVWMVQINGCRVHLYHKHRQDHPYHRHWTDKSVAGCVLEILSHDKFEQNGRKINARSENYDTI